MAEEIPGSGQRGYSPSAAPAMTALCPRCAVKLSGQPGAAPTAERDIAHRNFCLVAVYRPAAEGDEYLFHLQGRQPELLQSRQLRRAAGLSADGQLYSTADPEAYLMYLFCNARRQGAQRPCQPWRAKPEQRGNTRPSCFSFGLVILASCSYCMRRQSF